MSAFIVFVARLLALAAGLAIAAGLMAAALLGAAVLLLRAGWIRLVGASPRVFAWRRQPARVYVPSGAPRRAGRADISDVDPRY